MSRAFDRVRAVGAFDRISRELAPTRRGHELPALQFQHLHRKLGAGIGDNLGGLLIGSRHRLVEVRALVEIEKETSRVARVVAEDAERHRA